MGLFSPKPVTSDPNQTKYPQDQKKHTYSGRDRSDDYPAIDNADVEKKRPRQCEAPGCEDNRDGPMCFCRYHKNGANLH